MTSPFSIEHAWKLDWKRLPSNRSKPNYINDKSPKECAALDAIAKVGIIGGRQLSRLFGLDKKRLKRMEKEQKLVRHELRKNNQIIQIYTLGQVGGVIADLSSYPSNYWVEYQPKDVLKRLMFVELYRYFPNATIVPIPEPFVGAIEYNGKLLYTYVSRGSIKDLLLYLKWNGSSMSERLIVITESLQDIQSLSIWANNMKLRITTDHDLLDKSRNVQNKFYFFSDTKELTKEG